MSDANFEKCAAPMGEAMTKEQEIVNSLRQVARHPLAYTDKFEFDLLTASADLIEKLLEERKG